MPQEKASMNYVLFDLEVAESHWHDLQEEAAHERLAREAIRARKEAGHETLLDRLLKTLTASRRSTPTDARLN
jgi:hypothetical protein